MRFLAVSASRLLTAARPPPGDVVLAAALVLFSLAGARLAETARNLM